MAFRLGMIVFRKTVCSSPTNGTRNTSSSPLNHEDALRSVVLGIRVLQYIEQIATLDVEDEVLEPDAALR